MEIKLKIFERDKELISKLSLFLLRGKSEQRVVAFCDEENFVTRKSMRWRLVGRNKKGYDLIC